MYKSAILRWFFPLVGVCIMYSAPLSAESLYFPALFNISADSTENILLVNKSEQELYVLNSPAAGELQVLKKYRITTGRVNGNKQVEGDLKTPDGIYRIVDLLPGKNLVPKYGPMAFVLNYPNFVDRKLGRTGGGIWIHGRDEEIRDYLTEGCVSLNNSNLQELKSYIQINNTQVVIDDTLQVLTRKEYEKLRQQWALKFTGWVDSWEQGDTQTYFSYYSPLFQDGDLDLEGFKEKKRYLERVYGWKQVSADDVIVLHSAEETILSFTQEYYCPNFYSVGEKTLTLIPREHHWEIIAEDYSPTRPTLWKEQFLRDFVAHWITQWESGNFDRYIALYDTTFQTTDYNYHSWAEYKRGILAQAEDISVNASDFSYRSTGTMEWEVTFVQDYTADNYSDYGRKSITVRGYPDELKIIQEKWSPITRNE